MRCDGKWYCYADLLSRRHRDTTWVGCFLPSLKGWGREKYRLIGNVVRRFGGDGERHELLVAVF